MNRQLFDVYHGKGFPHRILQGVTLAALQDWCAAHGYKHQQHRDSPQGSIVTDAYVVSTN